MDHKSNTGIRLSSVSWFLKTTGILFTCAPLTAWAGDHHPPKVYVPVTMGYAAPTGYPAGAPIGQPMYLYPVAAAPAASYAMPMSTVANAPMGGYVMQGTPMTGTVANAPQAMSYVMQGTPMTGTVANAPQATVVQMGAAPSGGPPERTPPGPPQGLPARPQRHPPRRVSRTRARGRTCSTT